MSLAWESAALAALPISCQRVVSDSRQVVRGDVFLAFRGEYADGRDFIPAALAQGAAAVLWDDADGFAWRDEWAVPHLAVPDLRRCAGEIASHVCGHPSQKMQVTGITGTNGKTSISHWLAQAWTLLGHKAALIGTVGNGFIGALTDTTHTTPDPLTVQQLLASYQQQGAEVVSMEVSSHGLDQHRVSGVAFNTAIFTNLTRDHLDYHGDMARYGESKARLFHWDSLRHAVINADDAFGRTLLTQLPPQVQACSYSLQPAGGDVSATQLTASLAGLHLTVHTPWGTGQIDSPLLGRFNAANLLACLAALGVQGVPLAQACAVLGQIQPARGRMERRGGGGLPLVVVDYAHTPDALEKALATLREICPADRQLVCVFGCGGDRDTGKRPLMGEIAQRVADLAIVTNDNPRSEAPAEIVAAIVAGMNPLKPFEVTLDRATAIKWAIQHARVGDIVLIAGKGHETYQDIAGIRHAFSDIAVAEAALSVWTPPA